MNSRIARIVKSEDILQDHVRLGGWKNAVDRDDWEFVSNKKFK